MFSSWFGTTTTTSEITTTTNATSSSGSIPGVHETIIFSGTSMQRVMQVITKYDEYAQFLNGVDEVRIVNKSQDGKTVDVKWKVSVAFKTVEYTLRLTENRDGDGIQWTVLAEDSGPFSKNDGGWKLKKLNEEGTEIEATYYLDVDFNVWLPGFLKDALLGKSLPDTLAAFKKRIEEQL